AAPATSAPAAASAPAADTGPSTETREFTLSWEEKDMFFEVVDRKMKELMADLGWSDPAELERAVPFFDPDPHVVDSSGSRVEGPMMLFADDPSGFPLTFRFKLPRRKVESTEPSPDEKEAEHVEEAKEEEVDAAEEAEAEGEPAEAKSESPEPPEAPKRTPQECLQQLLDTPGLTLVFAHPRPKSVQLHESFGATGKACWKRVKVPGDYAEFEFSTDGDGGDKPDKRWGVLALAMPATSDDDSMQEKVDSFLGKWVEELRRATGSMESPTVERDAWDEARLRALCARHGWEFEWMTEDGERRRRAHEQWDVLKLSTPALPADTAEPDGTSGTP
ncbi:Nlrc3, partial [Symbiodinium pilosum]